MSPASATNEASARPLDGIRVLDLTSLAPGPLCSMVLADFGADVVSVERPMAEPFDPAPSLSRGKRSAIIDLRDPRGAEAIAKLADHADVLLEGNRPGTLERRGLGPDVLCPRNPRLIYARLTGWGQNGPYRDRAGHDINYTAISGTLGTIGTSIPVPPLAYVGDFAGGSLVSALGIMLALFERTVTGKGQVVDASIVDGSALLNITQLAELNVGRWRGRGTHVLSGAAPFYGVYECSDGRFFAVGAIEPKFYRNFLAVLDVPDVDPSQQMDAHAWPALRERVSAAFAAAPRSHWEDAFAGVDACGMPVLELDELAANIHLRERGTIVTAEDGSVTASPAPRLSRTPGRIEAKPSRRGTDTAAVLGEVGFSPSEIDSLRADGVIDTGS